MDTPRETYKDTHTFTFMESLRHKPLHMYVYIPMCVHTNSHTNAHTHRLNLTYVFTHKHTDRNVLTHRPTHVDMHWHTNAHTYLNPLKANYFHVIVSVRMEWSVSLDWTCNSHELLSVGPYIFHILPSFSKWYDFKELCIRNIYECIGPLNLPLCFHRWSTTFYEHTISCQNFLNRQCSSAHWVCYFEHHRVGSSMWGIHCVQNLWCPQKLLHHSHICCLRKVRHDCTASILGTTLVLYIIGLQNCVPETEPTVHSKYRASSFPFVCTSPPYYKSIAQTITHSAGERLDMLPPGACDSRLTTGYSLCWISPNKQFF